MNIEQKQVTIMNEIISAARAELENVNNTPTGNHLKTGDIRKISAKLFQNVKGRPAEYVFSVCSELLEQRNWPMGVIAYDFAYRIRKQYDEKTFRIFEGWLEKYVRGWGDSDEPAAYFGHTDGRRASFNALSSSYHYIPHIYLYEI